MNIIVYKNKNKKQVINLLKNIFINLGFEFNLKKIDNDLENIREIYFKEHGKFWILTVDDRIIGTIALKPSDGFYELKRFFILEEYRGKGYGNSALKYVLEYARQKGINKICLDAHNKLDVAIHLYRKYGFKEILPYKKKDDKNIKWMGLIIEQ